MRGESQTARKCCVNNWSRGGNGVGLCSVAVVVCNVGPEFPFCHRAFRGPVCKPLVARWLKFPALLVVWMASHRRRLGREVLAPAQTGQPAEKKVLAVHASLCGGQPARGWGEGSVWYLWCRAYEVWPRGMNRFMSISTPLVTYTSKLVYLIYVWEGHFPLMSVTVNISYKSVK